MTSIQKTLKIIFIAILLTAFTLSIWLWNKLPIRTGELPLDNLQSEVKVHYDKWGIPHIYAQKDIDGFRALGFVHGQDRLFQMDLLRRVGLGTLSELIGEKAIKVDKTFRTFGTHILAETNAKKLQQEHPVAAAKLSAYYDGVNQAIDKLTTPIEYTLLGAKPEHFKLEDAYGISAYMAHSFLSGIKTDPMLTAVKQSVSAQHFSELVLDWPETITSTSTTNMNQVVVDKVTSPASDALPRLSNEALMALADAGEAIAEALPFGAVHGSNGWAISSFKTDGALPIFANDPHMQFSVPAVWYEAQLKTDERNIYGHFAAGVPFPLLMRSENRIHGLTMLQSDDADIISFDVDKGSEADPVDRVLIEGRWEDVISRQEMFNVKGQEPVEFTVRKTSQGPIINDFIPTIDEQKDELIKQGDTQELVFHWLYTHPKNDVVANMYNIMLADDLEAMEKAIAPHISPGLNIIYADKRNNTAMWATGRFIKRHPGQTGKTIINGSVENSLPMGVYEFTENPKLINPESGFIFSTNNPYPGSEVSVKHTGYYSPIYRALTAERALMTEDKWTVKKSQALQVSSHNARWTHVKGFLNEPLNSGSWNELEAQAIAKLNAWNGEYRGDSIAASVFERFYFNLMQSLYADEIGQALFDKFVANGISDNSLYQILQRPESKWWDDISTEVVESQQDILQLAFRAAVTSLNQEFGGIDNWKWKTVAELTHPHPLGKVWPLNHLFNVGAYVVNGSKRALNNMIHTFTNEKIQITNGPSTRRVVDLANMENGYNINPVGQSGRWLDKHYSDQSAMYHRNEYRRATMLNQDDERISTMETLTLTP